MESAYCVEVLIVKKAIYFVIVVSGILTLFGLCLQWDSGSVGSGPYISEAVASSPGGRWGWRWGYFAGVESK